MPKPVYVLGTGLSHDGSSCLLKDGKIIVAIEKERLTRIKHDGGGDLQTVNYCLQAAGIGLQDLSLVVQAANFDKESISPIRYQGERGFGGFSAPIVCISHHLAHAYSAFATAPFDEGGVFVIDGCGSPIGQCDDLLGATVPDGINTTSGFYCEKDSFYQFKGRALSVIYKDFSEVRVPDTNTAVRLPTTCHSIGGLYSAVSNYCFGNMDDAGKLMGLAPYGKAIRKPPLFILKEGQCFVDYSSFSSFFTTPSTSYESFKANFQHYADIARWVQQETTKAVQYLVRQRLQLLSDRENLVLVGGVALNAVTNGRLLQQKLVKNLYIQPAAGDNGLAIGCAYYGWLKLLGQPRPAPGANIFFGNAYGDRAVLDAIRSCQKANTIGLQVTCPADLVQDAAASLSEGNIIGWFREGAEFGPRALGHRSILADPRIDNIQLRINRDIKNREDFRPFAPAVRLENAPQYFVYGYESPYMILTDQIRPEWANLLKGIVHVDGSCRVQTVRSDWDESYYRLLGAFEAISRIGVLLNTSFNTRGMPIVETPEQAIAMFCTTALDVLYIDNYKISK